MRTPSSERGSEELRATIHLAALRRFVAQGFVGARLKDIASDAGLGSGAHLYYYAPRKEDLFLEVVKTYALLPETLFVAPDAASDTRGVLHDFVLNYLEAFREETRLLAFRLLATEALRLAKGGAELTVLNLAGAVQRLEQWFADRVHDGSMREINPRRATHIVLGTLNYYVMYMPDGTPTAATNAEVAAELTDQLWGGLHG